MAKFARFWPGVALGAACMFGQVAAVAAQDLSADTVVATVNGTAITLGHMIVLRETLPDQYQALPDDVLFKGILEQLIQQAALEQSLAGKTTRRDALALDNSRRGYLSGVALEGVVAAAVTDAALQAAYDAKYSGAGGQTEYHAAHILVDTQEKAAALKAEIDGGADFAELARANSTDGAAESGGDLGWFGPGMMVKPFEDAVLAMKPGEVAGPVQTQFGWHLIKLDETRTASAPPLDQVRDELATEIEKTAVAAAIDALTAAATVTRPGEGIDPAALKDQSLLD
ncbi:MAG: peptidylprolyl isomerase [Pseudorhodobacter sp.]|nr:peptidylprolyl isomerase [Pseudorhodobacter sp.]